MAFTVSVRRHRIQLQWKPLHDIKSNTLASQRPRRRTTATRTKAGDNRASKPRRRKEVGVRLLATSTGAHWLALILTFSPWEKEQHLCRSSFADDGSANTAPDFSRGRRMIPPLLEE